MAEARVSVNLQEFNCSICLDLLKDPVTIHCGHSFCRICIKAKWDHDAQRRVYSCPMCRKTFTPRPELGQNIMLAEMVEKLRETQITERSLAGSEEVECDVCVGQKYKAVKSCLVCLASYCGAHFNLHNELNPGNKHKVIDTKENLRDRICYHHNKLKDVLCCTEDNFVCTECVMLGCRNHNTITLAQKRFQHKNEIGTIQKQLQERTQDAETKIKDIRNAIESIKSSALTTLDKNEKMFARIICLLEEKRSKMREMIKSYEKAEVQRAEEILKYVEKEMTKLKKREDELLQHQQLDDDLLFVKTFKSLTDYSTFENETNINVSLSFFKNMQSKVSEMTTKVDQFCWTELGEMHSPGKPEHVIQTSKPIIREDFFPYSCHLTVDETTIHNNLHLSEDNNRITYCDPSRDRPGTDRFHYHTQAVCGEVAGSCYWEAEWNGNKVYIAATFLNAFMFDSCYDCGFGHNNHSWSLCCTPSKCSFFHNSKETLITEDVPSKVGVYLDKGAGILAFYSVTDTMTLLYRVQTTFTEPLYPGFWVLDGSSVKIGEIVKKPKQHLIQNFQNPYNINIRKTIKK